MPVETGIEEDEVKPSDGEEKPGEGRRVRRRNINLLEGGASIRDATEKKVNDDEEEKRCYYRGRSTAII